MPGTKNRPDGPIVVRKYGGSSLADITRLRAVARDLKATHDLGTRLVVVVSAMGDTTDRLAQQAREANPRPPRRELDMLLTVGERISMSLLCMALAAENVPAISLTGSQAGIITDSSHTDAQILAVRPIRVPDALDSGHVVVIAGFQGVSGETKEITTLGRGGSDTSAVALAHALGAVRCEILKDVPGVMTADPKLVPEARRFERLDYEQMQQLAAAGCGVVHAKALAYALRHDVAIHVGSSFAPGPGTDIGPASAPYPPEPASFQPLALTVGKNQARLRIETADADVSADIISAAAHAFAAGSVTVEWLDGPAPWRWEVWGPVEPLRGAADAIGAAAASHGTDIGIEWQDQRAVISLAGPRPENWVTGLSTLRAALRKAGAGDVPVHTDGDIVRILVPEADLRRLARHLHETLLKN